jgi:hypothetical protein
MQGTTRHRVRSGTAADPLSLKRGGRAPSGHEAPLPALIALVRLLARRAAAEVTRGTNNETKQSS